MDLSLPRATRSRQAPSLNLCCSLDHLTRSLLLSLLLCLGVTAVVAQEPLPDPLSLTQALAMAAGHPRLTADSEFPSRPALFVACHDLAFSGAHEGGAVRNLAWASPLIPAAAALRLEIMQRFFDVLLADLSFARDNEAMAVAFVQLDRARARAELGQFSPLAVAELESDYQRIRRQRAASEAAQRLTRSLLARAVGRPGSLPSKLEQPQLVKNSDTFDLGAVVAAARRQNPRIKDLAAQRDSAQEQTLLDTEIQQDALELMTRLELLKLIAEQVAAEADWRDLKLDQSRTLYELEAQADLGFSMSQQTRAHRDQEQVALCQALTLAQLRALQGEPIQ